MTKQQTIESVTSYGVGATGILVGLADVAQAGTIIIAFLVVVIRLVYDTVRLYRYLTKGRDR